MDLKIVQWIPQLPGDTISGRVIACGEGKIFLNKDKDIIKVGYSTGLIDYAILLSKGQAIKITYLGGRGKSSLFRLEIEESKLDFGDVNNVTTKLFGL